MLRRLLLGLIKGVLLGGAIGAALQFGLHIPSVVVSWQNFLLYGVVGMLAGVVGGQPPWREGAWVASILKALFGFAIGAGLYWLGSKFLGVQIPGITPPHTTLAQAPLLFAPAVAAVYTTLVELDDGGEQSAAEKKTGVRVSAKDVSLDDLVPEERPESAARGTKAKR